MKRVLFNLLTALLTLVFFVELGRDMSADWARTQRTFMKTLARDERRNVKGGIRQLIIKDLNRVDRCTTCHTAIDKPQIALGEEPFKAHPGQMLQWHPPEKFGCTVCHGGQGLATEAKAAHGDVAHWEQPLLRGALVQASCAQCHGNLDQIAEHVPQLLRGRALFKEQGCYGCHAVKEFGQTVSQDLTEIGSKSYLLLEADFEMMDHPHDRIHWLKAKLRHPRMLNPGVTPDRLPKGEEEVFPSAMPHFGLAEDEIDIVLSPTKGHDEMGSYRRLAAGNRVDALVLSSPLISDERVSLLNGVGMPFVLQPWLRSHEPSGRVLFLAWEY